MTVAGLAGILIAGAPAQAGSTGRTLGCAAHWKVTAAWNECVDSPGAQIRLNVECDWQLDHTGSWKTVRGTINPVDEYRCKVKALTAWNGYR
ncbi:hypothetical protein ACGFIK_04040 [Micromonospora sp. NPDC048871]|uniref:hypothetical protein n=1 Tax=unclassified Micromonospora TaxID=2617518 RepID=UPI002E12ABD5|nr:hypothetical protein OIE53_17865 [Micromonospora sp. NBC_01739]